MSLSRRTAGALWCCYGGMVCVAISANLAPVYLTTFGHVFGGPGGLTEEELGRIPAIIFAGFVAGILISGAFTDRWGARLFALLGLAFTAFGLIFLGCATRYAELLAACAVLGVGAGMLDMVISPIVAALRPERRAAALNWLHSFYCSGAVGTVLVASAALYLEIPWRAVAVAIAIFPVLLLLGFSRMHVPRLVHEEQERTRVSYLLRHPWFVGAILAIALAGATEAGMAQWLPAYAERVLKYSKATGGLALAGFSVAMVAGRMLAATAARRIPPISLMLAGCALAVLFYLAGCFCPVAPAALAACVAVGFAESWLWPTMLGITADRFPHGGGAMFALLAASGNAGCFMIPWLVGLAAEATTLRYGLATAALCPAVLALLLVALGWRRTQKRDSPSSGTRLGQSLFC